MDNRLTAESNRLDVDGFAYDRACDVPLISPPTKSNVTSIGQARAQAGIARGLVVRHVRSGSPEVWRPHADAVTIISPRRPLEVQIRGGTKKTGRAARRARQVLRQVVRVGEIALIPWSSRSEHVFGAMDALVAAVPRQTIAAAVAVMGDDANDVAFRQIDRARDPWLVATITELWDETQQGPANARYVEAIATSFVMRLVKRYGQQAAEERTWGTSTEDLRIRRTLDYLEPRLTQHVPLAAVARHVGLSGPHLCEVFRQATGESIAAYIRRRRLQTARDLLASGDMAVSDVASRVGYASVAHFATAFRIAFGTSPGACRPRH
jgi:AraC-like DNA-binding protein